MKKPQFERGNLTFGFTLIELLVVIFIIVLLTTITLPNYRAISEGLNLERSANLLAQSLRKVLEKTMSSDEVGPVGWEIIPAGGYGLYLETGSPGRIILFADCQSNGNLPNHIYDPLGNICGQEGHKFPEMIEEIQLEKGVKIENLSPNSPLHITFQPPNPTVYINGSPASGGIEAEITLSLISDSSKRKKITINNTGLIDIE